ncbi:unnamed protein product [Polarella glacialis]|uniref:OTU domain-containing protein n=1 Tax=Polarella glacialis TaxID=89957 RepID=A0A813J0S7_POLGL|nr:unnamed protein product [Polarella glacialis]
MGQQVSARDVLLTPAAGMENSEDSTRLQRVSETGDGDCLFHALARQCLGSSTRAPEVRAAVCGWMEQHMLPSAVRRGLSDLSPQHRDEISRTMSDVVDFNGDDDKLLCYVQRMRRRGEWGSGLEALCAAYFYRRPVFFWCSSPNGPPVSTIEPPSAGNPPVGLLHINGNHWESIIVPADWVGSKRGFVMVCAPRPSAAEVADDRAFLKEDGPAPVVDPSRTDEQRRQQRERVASRYEALMPTNSTSSSSSSKPARRPLAIKQTLASKNALAKPPTTSVSNGRRTVSTSMSSVDFEVLEAELRNRRCLEALVLHGLTELQALEALTACHGDANQVKALYGIDSDVTQAESHAPGTSEDLLQRTHCVEALVRLGFSELQALEALTGCDGDVSLVKRTYGLDWDPVSGKTVQNWFGTPQ